MAPDFNVRLLALTDHVVVRALLHFYAPGLV